MTAHAASPAAWAVISSPGPETQAGVQRHAKQWPQGVLNSWATTATRFSAMLAAVQVIQSQCQTLTAGFQGPFPL